MVYNVSFLTGAAGTVPINQLPVNLPAAELRGGKGKRNVQCLHLSQHSIHLQAECSHHGEKQCSRFSRVREVANPVHVLSPAHSSDREQVCSPPCVGIQGIPQVLIGPDPKGCVI